MHACITTCSLGKYYASNNTTTAEKQRELSGTGQTKTSTANRELQKLKRLLLNEGIPVRTLEHN